MKAEHEYAIVVTTTETKEEAQRIARALLNARLAACIQIFPIESFYHWEGKMENAKEFRLEIKTRRKLYSKIERLLKSLHSYDLPEILCIPLLESEPRYRKWIDSVTEQNRESPVEDPHSQM